MKRILIFLLLFSSCFLIDYRNIALESLERETIKVKIDGEVKKPGVYEISNYATLEDLFLLCDLTDEADISSLNTEMVLHDNDQLTIPTKSEEIIKVSINTDSLEQLITLPGIGETTANKIIEYRNNHGLFQNIEDLKNVSGIGDKKYEKLLPYIKL